MPTVSICTVTARRWDIAMLLDVLARQTAQARIEWVVVDYSYEQNRDRFRALARDSGVCLVHGPNVRDGIVYTRDIARNRNRALAMASGDLIVFLDDFCLVGRDFVEQHERVARDGAVSAGEMFAMPLGRDGPAPARTRRAWWPRRRPPHASRVIEEDDRSRRLGYPSEPQPALSGGWTFTGNLAASARAFETLNGFDPRFSAGGEDSDFGLRAELAGLPIVFNPRAVSVNLDTSTHPYVFAFDHPHDAEYFRVNKGTTDNRQNMRVEVFAHHREAVCTICGAREIIDHRELFDWKRQAREYAVPTDLFDLAEERRAWRRACASPSAARPGIKA